MEKEDAPAAAMDRIRSTRANRKAEHICLRAIRLGEKENRKCDAQPQGHKGKFSHGCPMYPHCCGKQHDKLEPRVETVKP
ncbi:hypothetical protein [Marispirochaeta aestuarii]|uniref:hypothetical protein n=1 Tax=Marispirochaeta aestuarii TaxID=1963862 RepID=UPI0029C82082|nr:hypothetical protein [Marispirochaeta aestuarii]